MAAPGVIAFFRTWLRLLTVQACFNYDRMIGVGIGYASEPLLRALPGGPEGERYRAAMSRAGRYFNAHPYLTGLAAGALTRAEHDGVPGEQIERLRTALLGPLGAVGDRLVWAGTLPAASAVGLALSAGARAGVGAAALLALYNVPHVVLRVWGLRAGWRHGTILGRGLASPALETGRCEGRKPFGSNPDKPEEKRICQSVLAGKALGLNYRNIVAAVKTEFGRVLSIDTIHNILRRYGVNGREVHMR